MGKKIEIIVAASFFVVTIVVLLAIFYHRKKSEKYIATTGNMGNIILDVPDSNDFYIYNYYKVSIDVGIIENDENSKQPNNINKKKEPIIFVTNIAPGQKKGISNAIAEAHIKPQNDVMIYEHMDIDSEVTDRNDLSLLGKAKLHYPKDKMIRAIHAGLNVGKTDMAVVSDPVKSPLGGTVLPRLRIVNTLCRPLRLYTVAGGNGSDLIIKPGDSILYFGQWNNNGIPLGVTLKDRDNILQDYKIRYFITDLFMGLTSDQPEPLYGGGQIGNEFDDTINVSMYPLQINNIQFHKGALIDRSFIPLNW